MIEFLIKILKFYNFYIILKIYHKKLFKNNMLKFKLDDNLKVHKNKHHLLIKYYQNNKWIF